MADTPETQRPDPVGERNYALSRPVVRAEGEGTPGAMHQTRPVEAKAPVVPVVTRVAKPSVPSVPSVPVPVRAPTLVRDPLAPRHPRGRTGRK